MASFDKLKVIKETIWGFAAKGTAFLLLFLLNVYLARSLGIEQFGIWSFFFSIITIITFFSGLGIDFSTKKYLAQYNNELELKNILKSSIKLRFIVSLVFSIFIVVIHEPLAIIIGRPEFASLFLLSVPMILLAGFVEFLKQAYIGLHRIKYNFIINFFEFSLKLLFVVIFFTISLDISSIIDSFILAYLISALIGFYMLLKFYRKTEKKETKDFTKDIFKYSFPLFIITIGYLIATEIDTVMLGLLSTDAEVGIYGVAKQVVIKLPHISVAMAMGSLPIFAKLNDGNKTELRILFYKLLKTNALIFLVISSGIFFLSSYFIPLIFGIEYSASVLPLKILTVHSVIISFSILLGTFLDYQGLAKKRALYLSGSMILNIFLNLLLIPEYGAIGAAMATSVSYLPYIVLNWIEANRCLR